MWPDNVSVSGAWCLCFYFPTILIVLLAVFNDGMMIALSKDRVSFHLLGRVWQLLG